jgi:hypothetical protein
MMDKSRKITFPVPNALKYECDTNAEGGVKEKV